MKKSVFIGSSKESLNVAEKIAECLESLGVDVLLWENAFKPGEYSLESLEKAARSVSGAIFIFNEDDKTWYRGEEHTTVRDNVLFEYGLFSGYLSRKQVVFVCVDKPKLPTDLFGITYLNISFDKKYTYKNILKEWSNALPCKESLIGKELLKNQPYYILDEEYGFEYCDCNNAVYHNITNIKSQVKYLRYYTERYSWVYGGKLKVTPSNQSDKLVDKIKEGEYTAYTLRLNKVLSVGEEYKTGFKLQVTDTNDIRYMFLGSVLSYSHIGKVTFWVKLSSDMRIVSATFKRFEKVEDISPAYEEKLIIENPNYVSWSVDGERHVGEYYMLEWQAEDH